MPAFGKVVSAKRRCAVEEKNWLEVFAQAIGAGYQGYRITEGKGVYSEMDLVPRWDRELYEDALRKLLS